MPKPQSIALTGAAGFIGANVAAQLHATGVHLRGLAGARGELRKPAILSQIECVYADVTDTTALNSLFEGVDTVIHAAGPPSVAQSFSSASEYVRVHTLGTTLVLEACVLAGVQRIVFLSSAEIYGNQTPPVVKETQPMRAVSPYGAAKIGAEQMVHCYAAAGRIEAFVVRPFSVYGPGMSDAGVVSEFLRQAANGDTIRVRDPRPIRDFCYVDDVARAITLACSADIEGFAVANIGSGVGTTIGELASSAAKVAGAPAVQECGTKRPAGSEIACLIADTAEAERLLGWRAATALHTGLESSLDWIRQSELRAAAQ